MFNGEGIKKVLIRSNIILTSMYLDGSAEVAKVILNNFKTKTK